MAKLKGILGVFNDKKTHLPHKNVKDLETKAQHESPSVSVRVSVSGVRRCNSDHTLDSAINLHDLPKPIAFERRKELVKTVWTKETPSSSFKPCQNCVDLEKREKELRNHLKLKQKVLFTPCAKLIRSIS